MSGTNPDRFADQLVLYVLGELPAAHCAEFKAHLEECAECRREYLALQSDAARLALSTAGAAPPTPARERLLRGLAKEQRVPASPRWPRWFLAPVFASAALAVVVLFLFTKNLQLQEQLRTQQLELASAQDILTTMTSPEAVKMTLVAANSTPQPQGRVFYIKSKGKLLFFASHCLPVPPGKVYELWLIPVEGQPLPAGTFWPDEHGTASVVLPSLPANVEAKTFAITVEPEGGSAAPTSAPIMLGL